jgi:hypothetical protein
MFTSLLLPAILSVLANIVFSALIVHELRERDVNINYFLARLLLLKYVHRYREITKKERGTVGGLYYAWVISINAALVFGVAGLVVRAI